VGTPLTLANTSILTSNIFLRVSEEECSRASTTCQGHLFIDIENLTRDHQLSDFPQGFIDSVNNSKGSRSRSKEERPLAFVYILGRVSENFKRIGNRYNIRTIFRPKHNLRSSLMKTRREIDP
jgi:hypothetical protein